MKLEFERRILRFARPMQTSYGSLDQRELLAVSLTGDDGVVGYGEAAPLARHDALLRVPASGMPPMLLALAARDDTILNETLADGSGTAASIAITSCGELPQVT